MSRQRRCVWNSKPLLSGRSQSIRRQTMTLLGLALLATLLLVAGGVLLLVSRNERIAWRGRQEEAARHASEKVADFVLRMHDSLHLVSLLGREHLAREPGMLDDVLEQNPALVEIICLDENGHVIAHADRDVPPLDNPFTIPQSTWFLRAQSDDIFLSDLQISPHDEPYVIMSIPAREGGVVAVRLRFDVLWDVVADVKFGRTGQSYVISPEGEIVAHTTPEVALARTSLKGRPELAALLEAPEQSWGGSYTNFQGVQVLGLTRRVPGTDWIVITELARSEASAVSRSAQFVLVGGTLFFGLLAQMAIGLLTRRLVFYPLEDLRVGAQRIGQGDLGHRISIVRRDEIGQVAQEFNEMVDHLQQREAQLAARTAELAAEVTERKRTETELQESELRYRALFEHAPVGIGLASVEGRVLVLNDAMAQMMGYTPEELDQITLDQVYQDPQDRASLIGRLQCGGSVRAPEVALKRSDGTPCYADLTMTALVLGDEQILMTVALDVTERKRAEDERLRLAAAVDQAAEAIVIFDSLGLVRYANPAFERITGHARRDVRGKPVEIVGDGARDAAFYRQLWPLLKQGRAWRGSFGGRRKDGTPYEAEGSISPVRDAEGRTVDYVMTLHDVTERTMLEAQLRQSQKMQAVGQLAGGVAHDFNNLLTAIMGYAEFMANDLSADSPLRGDLGEIQKVAEHAAALTRQLLTFSRTQVLQPRVLDLNETVSGMRSMLRRLIREDIELATVLAPGLGSVRADPGQIEQVIVNLVVNARDAMPQGGVLTVETGNVNLDALYASRHVDVKPGPYVRLAVSDDGIGMDEQVLSRLFEPFFTTKAEGKGTGLGLATVYGIVSQSGGHIDVESEPGVGTTFYINLPRLSDQVSQAGPGAGSQPVPRGTERILLVEDEEAVRMLVQRVLERQGYTVVAASRPRDALQFIERSTERSDMLITDMVMPEMSGRELADRVTAAYPEMKVLYISGYTGDALGSRAELDKDAVLLPKPFTPADIARKVRQVLDSGGS